MQNLRQPAIGDQLASFRIEALVGRGGMGLVFRARQARPDRMVALKVIAPELASDEAFRARFEQESSVAAQIEHPNVIPVYEVGEDGGIVFIAMRFVNGTDLGKLRGRCGRLEPAHATRLVSQVASALDAAHARGLVHRDVKPGNMLVSGTDPEEHIYLTDFGLTKRNNESRGLTASGMYVGTLDYIAPEQVTGNRVDASTDVYSLGCVLYELLAGGVPFPRETDAAKVFAHVSSQAPPLIELIPDVPPQLSRVVERAMAKDPADRYESAGAFARAARETALDWDLARAARETSVRPPPVSERNLATRPAPPVVRSATRAGATETKLKQADPKQFDSEWADPARVDPVRVDPTRVDPARVDPVRVDPTRVDPARVDPVRVDPTRADPARVDPEQGDRWAVAPGSELPRPGERALAGTDAASATADRQLRSTTSTPAGTSTSARRWPLVAASATAVVAAVAVVLILVSGSGGAHAGAIRNRAKTTTRVQGPGPDPRVASQITQALESRAKVLDAAAARFGGAHLPSRAAGLKRVAIEDEQVAGALTHISGPQSDLGPIAALAAGLGHEAALTRQLASAALRSDTRLYESLRGRLAADRLDRAGAELTAVGFGGLPLPPIDLPRAPSRPRRRPTARAAPAVAVPAASPEAPVAAQPSQPVYEAPRPSTPAHAHRETPEKIVSKPE
jgi:serine/threonine protein kinase